MGTWISHLRIAENLLAALPGLDEAAFTCGNLAPDSGIPNADWTAFDPPKEVTHFLRTGEDESQTEDLYFYQTYLAGLALEDDRSYYSLVLGYFCHLLCDNLWWRRIAYPSEQAYPSFFAEGRERGWRELKRDWYDLDHLYVRNHPGSLFWRVFMDAPNPPAYLPFLSEAGLHQSLDYIREFYRESGSRELNRPYPYLNEATMARYVADSTAAVLKIYHRLQEAPAPSQTHTALVLLSEEEIAPYPLPLGDLE